MLDVIVLGGGHAGCEAVTAAARRGAHVALITFARSNIGQLSCNPSIGGVGKGHLVRELDVFDGLMACAADSAAIHRRMLNSTKGSAVHGPRIQADRSHYRCSVQSAIEATGVTIVEDEVARLLIAAGRVRGVVLASGTELVSKTVVITTGTFLGARLFCGLDTLAGGRIGERSSLGLADQVEELGLAEGRLKTGTPPRVDGRTIDWARLVPQPTDADAWSMSALAPPSLLPQLDCALTRTNVATHELIEANLDRSPLFAGAIEGRGPRYCPSIEDKVKRFADRESHQIFLEPEGLDTTNVYPNGISTSLPADVQLAFVRTIEGLERAEIVQPGYAVEYAFLDPRRLDGRLAHHELSGLFLAGQVNGTTGYEEAAAQGLVAGLNAAADALNLSPVTFDRESSYIGVMIDDLTLHGVTEPYRMMTARAEYRLHLRADNAMTRLGEAAIASNCVSVERRVAIEQHAKATAAAHKRLANIVPASELDAFGSPADRRPLGDWLRRPGMRRGVVDRLAPIDAAMAEAIEDSDYAPYIERQRAEWAAMRRDRALGVPVDFAFDAIQGLSREMIERLESARPANIDQASRVRGVTPAALSALHFALVRAA